MPSDTDSNHIPDDENCFTHGHFFSEFCTSKFFLIILCGFVLVQSMAINGLFPVRGGCFHS